MSKLTGIKISLVRTPWNIANTFFGTYILA
jgi:hypothetical protein